MMVREVIEAWAEGKPGTGGAAVWTDGQHLFSYALCIGTTTPEGVKVVLDAGAGSVTTQGHINMAKRYAGRTEQPSQHGRSTCTGACDHATALSSRDRVTTTTSYILARMNPQP